VPPLVSSVAVISVVREAVLGGFGVGQQADSIVLANVGRTTVERSGQNAVSSLVVGAKLKFGVAGDVSGVLLRQKLRAGRAIRV
jgi:hypothetical protein